LNVEKESSGQSAKPTVDNEVGTIASFNSSNGRFKFHKSRESYPAEGLLSSQK
jgi:hypothetical protein